MVYVFTEREAMLTVVFLASEYREALASRSAEMSNGDDIAVVFNQTMNCFRIHEFISVMQCDVMHICIC